MGLETVLIIAGILLLVLTTLHGLGLALLIAGLVLVVVELVVFLVFGSFFVRAWKRF